MNKKPRLVYLILLFLALLIFVPQIVMGQGKPEPAVSVLNENSADAIPGNYIVVYKDDVIAAQSVAVTAVQTVDAYGGELHYTYNAALKGFAATLSETAVSDLLEDPNIAYVEADQIVSIAQQNGATWGLDRIDQRNLPLNSTYGYNLTGAGVHAYIIDTGIRTTHSEFTGRTGNGHDAVGGGTNDCNGHGTHVAGTIAGTTYGVAKDVVVHSVRVLGCDGSGTLSAIVAGADWVVQNHQSPAVANMSLGGSASTAMDDAAQSIISAGITLTAAAGNSGDDACGHSPARLPAAVTVGNSNSSDSKSSASSYGTCLDLFAPGSNITSAWIDSDTSTNTISGTSMAAPHVAGVAALYLEANPSASPAQVRNAIVNGATPNKLSNIGAGSPNLLLYSLFIGDIPITPTPTSTVPSTPLPEECLAPAWSSAQTYNDGDIVSHNDHDWQASISPVEPGTNGQWGVWIDLGICEYGTPTPTPTSTASPTVTSTPTDPGGSWQAGTTYSAGQQVTYGGQTYKCLQAHTALAGWEPPNVPALWQPVN